MAMARAASNVNMNPYLPRKMAESPFNVNKASKSQISNTMASVVAASREIPARMDPYFEQKVKGHQFKPCEEMKYEGVRLTTFKDWPRWGAVWPTVLAKAGFFYTKTADQVACFCCGGRLKTWEAGDSPMTEHKRFFPQCRFVTGQDSTNVPFGEAPVVPSGGHGGCTSVKTDYYSTLAKQAAAGRSEASGPSSLNHLTQSSMRHHESLSMATGGTTCMHSLTLTQIREMKLESKRLESFNDWPISAYVRPEDLAKAGVYYLGMADRVRCAFCNGILRNWQPGDEPLEVHQKHFPKCAFVKDAQTAGNVSIEEEKVNIQQASQVGSVNCHL